MSYKVQKIANLRTVKALRGQSLTIDLGKTKTGTLSAWMKKDPTDATFRSFTIVDQRFLFLPKEKTQDLSATDLIEGKWYFDVRQLPVGSVDPNDEQTIYTGTIEFSNQVTDSNGSEVATTPEAESGMISLSNTASVYGTVGQVVKAKDLIKDISEIKTVKAMRGESLSIDLGKDWSGYKLEAWMKKSPNSSTYRSFTIVDDQFIYLPKEKTQDYYDATDSTKLLEAVNGKWYFDVRAIPNAATNASDEQIVTKGVIYFEDNVTDSSGSELVFSQEAATSFIGLSDTPINYAGEAGKVLKVNSTQTAVEFASIEEDKNYVHDQGVVSAVWTIQHNLNKYPAIVAVDSAKSVVTGAIDYIDLNNITITFNAAFSGEAYLN
tara:strand:- start:179 stop:1315 length:1137 start_codon:yes stop_codon:yes gene_type:complete